MYKFTLGFFVASVFWIYWFYYHPMVRARFRNRNKILIDKQGAYSRCYEPAGGKIKIDVCDGLPPKGCDEP